MNEVESFSGLFGQRYYVGTKVLVFAKKKIAFHSSDVHIIEKLCRERHIDRYLIIRFVCVA